MHTFAAHAVIVLAGIHLGLNWRWVINAVQHVFVRRAGEGLWSDR